MAARFNRREIIAALGWGALACGAGTVTPGLALAAVKGRVRLTRSAIDEDSGSWRVMMTLRLATTSPSAQLALRFVFQQHVDFERVDGDGGVSERRRPVSPPRTLTEDKTIDFSDPSGGIGRDARAELLLTRDRTYRAGEWTLEVQGPDGALGPRVALTLRGANPPATTSTERQGLPRRADGLL